jgi:hypothetical protein
MPTSKEIVAQRPLQAAEARKIIVSDVDNILAQSGLFSGHIAYGRLAYEVRVILHMDNPAYPKDESVIRSKPYPKDVIEGEHGHPELEAIEKLPLRDPSPDAYLAADELHREIVSPNAARVEHGLPITVIRREQNSETREELVHYDKSAIEGQANPNPEPVITDVTESVRKELEDRK